MIIDRYKTLFYYDGPQMIYSRVPEGHLYAVRTDTEDEWIFSGGTVHPSAHVLFWAGRLDYKGMMHFGTEYVSFEMTGGLPWVTVPSTYREVIQWVEEGLTHEDLSYD